MLKKYTTLWVFSDRFLSNTVEFLSVSVLLYAKNSKLWVSPIFNVDKRKSSGFSQQVYDIYSNAISKKGIQGGAILFKNPNLYGKLASGKVDSKNTIGLGIHTKFVNQNAEFYLFLQNFGIESFVNNSFIFQIFPLNIQNYYFLNSKRGCTFLPFFPANNVLSSNNQFFSFSKVLKTNRFIWRYKTPIEKLTSMRIQTGKKSITEGFRTFQIVKDGQYLSVNVFNEPVPFHFFSKKFLIFQYFKKENETKFQKKTPSQYRGIQISSTISVEKLLFVFVDSEFEGDIFISLQVHVQFYIKGNFFMKSFIIFNEEFQDFCEKTYGSFQTVKGENVEIFYRKFDEKNNVLLEVLSTVLEKMDFFLSYKKDKILVFLYFYYSWKDLRACFGFENLRKILSKKHVGFAPQNIFQRRNIKGWFSMNYPISKDRVFTYKFVLKDLFGWNSFGLKTLVQSQGLSKEFLPEKDLMDPYKKT